MPEAGYIVGPDFIADQSTDRSVLFFGLIISWRAENSFRWQVPSMMIPYPALRGQSRARCRVWDGGRVHPLLHGPVGCDDGVLSPVLDDYRQKEVAELHESKPEGFQVVWNEQLRRELRANGTALRVVRPGLKRVNAEIIGMEKMGGIPGLNLRFDWNQGLDYPASSADPRAAQVELRSAKRWRRPYLDRVGNGRGS